jgi:UDP-N-acetylglucosamine--N-acetylmuramyl-(pentapeptide) pyrophosphoryl-undecaprenol N-acetylglucosamine transferase
VTIILTGGGSGGHVTPLLAIAQELKKAEPSNRIVYIGQRGDRFADIVTKSEYVDNTFLIRAGKFRRFHGEGIKQLLDVSVFLKNVRDFFYVLIGILQSIRIMRKLKPKVVFSRGGYVSVPVALGAHFNHVSYITHDSDPVPSLANRLIAPWAAINAVALPGEIYPYPKDKMITTGVPISNKFVPVTEKLKQGYRKQIDIPDQAKLLFVIGGGLGSQTLNKAVVNSAPELLNAFKDLYIIHVGGETNEDELRNEYKSKLTKIEQGRIMVFGYVSGVYKYSGAADVVITRAGATNLAEFAVQGKACIVVPSAFLTGGHQVKSAELLDKSNAAAVVNETDISDLSHEVSRLLSDTLAADKLSENLSKLVVKHSTEKIAKLILELGYGREVKRS